MSGRLSRLEDADWEEIARQSLFQPSLMAELCPVSLRQMQRLFTERFKKTPTSWTRELRCRLARELIALGWSNKAVVSELGFSNESHLCHDFKRVYGTSPQSFGPIFTKPPANGEGPAGTKRPTTGVMSQAALKIVRSTRN